MKKINVLVLWVALLGIFQLVGCSGGGDDPKPITDLIQSSQKSWKAKTVKENGAVVYEDAGAKPQDYSKFKIKFTSSTAVELIEVDGVKFTGTWALTNNNTTLKLSGLTPEPTGGAVIEYTTISATETELKFTRSGTNPKTGKSNVEYTLF